MDADTIDSLVAMIDGPVGNTSTDRPGVNEANSLDPDADTQEPSRSPSPEYPNQNDSHKMPLRDRQNIQQEEMNEPKNFEIGKAASISQESAVSSIEWSQQGQKDACPQSPNVSVIPKTTTTDRRAVPSKRRKRKINENARENMLDELFSNVENMAEAGITGGVKQLPTSTPLRKPLNSSHADLMPPMVSINQRPFLGLTKQNSSFLTVADDTKDSGCHMGRKIGPNVHVPILSGRTLCKVANSSVMTDNSVMPASMLVASELNSSYHQNIRILVQWKSRTLLIPVSR